MLPSDSEQSPRPGSLRRAVTFAVPIGGLWVLTACGEPPEPDGPGLFPTSAGDGSGADTGETGHETGEETGGGGDGSSGSGDTTTGGDADTGGTSGGSDGGDGGDGSTSGGSTTGGSGTGGDSGTGGSTGGTGGTGGDGDPNEDGWEIIDVGTDEDLVAIDFADDQHGWLVGTNEILLHTDDGGDSWHSQHGGFWTATTDTKQLQAHTISPYPAWHVYHLLDVHAVSDSVAWVSSIGPLESPVSLHPDHLTAVFVTVDGGTNWRRLTLATNFQVWGIHGFDGQSARAATIGSDSHADSDVYLIDSGANQDNAKVSWGGLRDIVFVDGQEGWAVGSGIFHTENKGSSWGEQDAPGAFYQAVAFVDASHGWAVGKSGKIVATVDGGESWSPQDSGGQTDLYGVSFVDASHGFVVGDDGIVLRTEDGGETWLEEDSGTGQWINDVVALDSDQAWASADGGVLLHRVP